MYEILTIIVGNIHLGYLCRAKTKETIKKPKRPYILMLYVIVQVP